MFRALVAAPHSGSGKTIVTCALLAALQKRGKTPCAFKCGPDYIDPLFHRAALGVESHNLDLFLADEDSVRMQFQCYAAGHGAALCEGVMGYYDGLGGVSTCASSWHLAEVLHLPVLLVLRPKGSSLTLAAQVKGLLEFRTPSHLVGILLSDCAPMLYQTLAPMLERETGLPVLGFLPHCAEADLPARHLGLYTAGEVGDLSWRIERLACLLEEHVDMPRLLALCEGENLPTPTQMQDEPQVRIAVAQDEAFCFCYEETLDTLRAAGAELCFFSPLRDAALPPHCGGLYLPGGYPELHAQALSENERLRVSIREAVMGGLPTVAECGGFLYLGASLEDETCVSYPMVGVLPGGGVRTERLQRFGYAHLTAEVDSLLFRAGERIPVHEFHYWDSSDNGDAVSVKKPLSGRTWRCGFASRTLWAGFPHLYFAGNPNMAERFVRAAKELIP